MIRALTSRLLTPSFFHRTMSSNIKAIADQVKFDILSQNHVLENAAKAKEIARTFILPTQEMYAYASLATIGDDVYHDPSTIALEAHMAQLTGKEAALFMPSGTASNQIALRTHLRQPPYSVLCDNPKRRVEDTRRGVPHSILVLPYYLLLHQTVRIMFFLARLLSMRQRISGHHLTLADVEENVILGTDIHFAPTEVIALENTLNGTIFPQDEIIAISDFAHLHSIKMHLDGARIWHVAIETERSIKELCDPFDSISLCFSKGLGAPVGSCLVGPKEFIKKARWFRKLFGGGMRQTGILAASAAYALTHNFPQLARVHAFTKKLESGLEAIGVEVTSKADTCMVFYDAASVGLTYDEVAEKAGTLPEPLFLGGSRLVVHIQTSEAAVDDFLALIKELAEQKKAEGFVKPAAGQQSNGHRDVYVRRTAGKAH
ncbi:putative low-specificity L-threonine aldolase [Hypsizygus marmoreus]|uniref:Low-specificity L-threonine aldolase n=1 Tax=Hypsizygus marmoreus TaxID=39966 RepID=A0A369K4U4_HYPMA|nr:putative low-specificity L-threonine aldolase [Hypsizygus marmoreus]